MKNQPTNTLIERHLAVTKSNDLNPAALAKLLQGEKGFESGFVRCPAPVAPKFDTRMTVVCNRGEVAIAAFLNSIPARKEPSKGDLTFKGTIEVLFDFRCDGFGFAQYIFEDGRQPFCQDFSPYPEAKTTSWQLPRPKRWGFQLLRNENPFLFVVRRHLFYAVFDEDEIFSLSDPVGFNLVRNDGLSGEFSSWSFCAGHGAPDANSLGRLHRKKRAVRHRRAPVFGPPERFQIAITNDSPMVIVNRSYNPARFDAEMKTIKSWGATRLHWIDNSNFDSFWAMPGWARQYQDSVKACGGPLLPVAAKAARRHGIELVTDFKIFDLSFTAREGTPPQKDCLPGLDGPEILCIPEMVGSKEAFMQTNPAWRRQAAFPIHTLRLFSTRPLPAFDPGAIKISQSSDNIHFTKVKFQPEAVVCKKINRSNRRWTPAGPASDPGRQSVWMIEIRDIKITRPFVAFEIPNYEGVLEGRHFALVEAVGADGSEAPFICSDTHSHRGGNHRFDFFGNWPGWNNYSDHAWGPSRFHLKNLGLALFEPTHLPGMLEPCHATAQRIWLDRVDFYLEHDIHGLSVRPLCHHRRCPSWLQYAFAPAAIEAFEKKHGRQPNMDEADYVAMRQIRGEAYGDFLAEASRRARRRGKKFMMQVETGGELPPDRESRMAIYFDYQKWISEGLFDELHVRATSGHSPWLRQTLLPLAKKHGVKLVLMTRNLASGFGHPELADIHRIAADTREIGYDGINFYESANVYELTEEDTVMPRAMGDIAVRAAAEAPKPFATRNRQS